MGAAVYVTWQLFRMLDVYKRRTYEWQTAVAVTCALLNNIKSGRENTMALDEARGEREYLFGRLLGIAAVSYTHLHERACGARWVAT